MKKFLAKLIGWGKKEEKFSAINFRTGQKEETKLVRERQEQIMRSRDKRYVSERTVPTEAEVTGPSESKKHQE